MQNYIALSEEYLMPKTGKSHNSKKPIKTIDASPGKQIRKINKEAYINDHMPIMQSRTEAI